MIFILNCKKYDTDKMEKIADVKKGYGGDGPLIIWPQHIYDCELWKSEKDNWLLTRKVSDKTVGEAIDKKEAKRLMLEQCDVEIYEQLFGEIEEA